MSLALLIPAVHFMNFMTINPAFYPLLKSRIFVKLSMKKLGILHTSENSQLQDPDSTKIERIKITAGFRAIHKRAFTILSSNPRLDSILCLTCLECNIFDTKFWDGIEDDMKRITAVLYLIVATLSREGGGVLSTTRDQPVM